MAPPTSAPSSPTASDTGFGAVRQIDAGLLDVGYVDTGPADGPVVLLLHGWPYDIHSYVDVAPSLVGAGYRAIIPYVRGFGTTRFLSDATFRNGEQAALALDVIALMDALQIESAVLAGFDWGARTAGRHRRRAVAGTMHRARFGERVSDREPGGRQASVTASS